MFYIIKSGDENFNVVSDPSTGEPMAFEDAQQASDFADSYGFSDDGVEIMDLDPSVFERTV